MANVVHEWVSFAAGGIFAFCVVAVSACGGGSATTLDAPATTLDAQATTLDAPATTLDAPMITRSLTVVLAGNGTVTLTPGGQSCSASCTLTVADGAAVTLTATALGASTFAGWRGGSCIGTGPCTFAASADVSINASFVQGPNIVFVTSTTQTGNLGGLAGADNICQARADAAGLLGSYRAWLSTTTVSAISRLGSASGWVRPDGKPVVNTTADLAVGKMFYPIRVDENGVDVGDDGVMTATTHDGTLHPSLIDCSGFTVADDQFVEHGQTSGVSSSFTAFGRRSCARAQRLYCFGVSTNNATVALTPPISFRRAFITIAAWTPGGGLASADNLCSSEASGGGLPGSYKALLATSTASAASRFNTADGTAPWARVDGVLLAATPAALFTATLWDTGMTVRGNGTYTDGDTGVWGGATSLSVAGTAALTCGGTWESTAGTGGSGRNGFSSVSTVFSFDNDLDPAACTTTFNHVVCLQE